MDQEFRLLWPHGTVIYLPSSLSGIGAFGFLSEESFRPETAIPWVNVSEEDLVLSRTRQQSTGKMRWSISIYSPEKNANDEFRILWLYGSSIYLPSSSTGGNSSKSFTIESYVNLMEVDLVVSRIREQGTGQMIWSITEYSPKNNPSDEGEGDTGESGDSRGSDDARESSHVCSDK